MPITEDRPAADMAHGLAEALGNAYALGPELGRGGMAVVFRATDLRLRREVAIKVLPPQLSGREDLRKRFVREAQLAAGLSHPNIIPIYDVGERGDLVWFVMQYVEGESLRRRVERTGPQAVAFATQVLREVGYALAYAHARGIVHRDIKPDNILLERFTGRALVADFGIAKGQAAGDATTLTGEGVLLGTTGYMSPEQAAAEAELVGRSDLYSLGLVGHYLLTGHDVHRGPNAQALLVKVLTKVVPAVRDSRVDVPDWLNAAILGCTARSVAERYQRAEELLEQLSAGATPVEVHPAARKLLREVAAYAGVGTLVAWVWWLLNGPPIDVRFVQGFTLAAAAGLWQRVSAATSRGVGWKEIRQALLEARRLRAEEHLWEGGEGESATTLREQLGGIGTQVLPFVVVVGLGLVCGVVWLRYRPAVESPAHEWAVLLAMAYGLFSTTVFVRLFQLPRYGPGNAQGPHRSLRLSKAIPVLGGVAGEWAVPSWMDRLGRLLFIRIGRGGPEERPSAVAAAGDAALPAVPPPGAHPLLPAPPSSGGTRRVVDAAMDLASEIRRQADRHDRVE